MASKHYRTVADKKKADWHIVTKKVKIQGKIMPGNSSQPWGLMVPGRPPTRSEGAAQCYNRVGPQATQKTRTFENGTCLIFGPLDLVDEFDYSSHPFINQVALIDTVIRDCKAARTRYEGSGVKNLITEGEGQGNEAQILGADDPFNGFRQDCSPFRALAPESVAHLDSGVYVQVPSKYATCNNLISVYSNSHKGDVRLDVHSGYGTDTRFGVIFKSSEVGFQQFQRAGNQLIMDGDNGEDNDEDGDNGYNSGQGDSRGNRNYRGNGNRWLRSQRYKQEFPRRKSEQHGSLYSRIEAARRTGKNGNRNHTCKKISNEAQKNTGNQIYQPTPLHIPIHTGQLLADQMYAEQSIAEAYRTYPPFVEEAEPLDDGSIEQRHTLDSYIGQTQAIHECEPNINFGFLETNAWSQMPAVNQREPFQNMTLPPGLYPANNVGQPFIAELEGSIPLQSGHTRAARGGHQRLRAVAAQEYAKYLDEDNAKSKEQGEMQLKGDIISRDARTQHLFRVPHNIGPAEKEATEHLHEYIALNIPSASSTSSSMVAHTSPGPSRPSVAVPRGERQIVPGYENLPPVMKFDPSAKNRTRRRMSVPSIDAASTQTVGSPSTRAPSLGGSLYSSPGTPVRRQISSIITMLDKLPRGSMTNPPSPAPVRTRASRPRPFSWMNQTSEPKDAKTDVKKGKEAEK